MKRKALGFFSLAFLYFSLVAHGQKVDHATGQILPPGKNVVVSDIQGTELMSGLRPSQVYCHNLATISHSSDSYAEYSTSVSRCISI